jgi:hypothetical protein
VRKSPRGRGPSGSRCLDGADFPFGPRGSPVSGETWLLLVG